MSVEALRTDAGAAALAAAAEVAGTDPLRAAAALRARGVPPDLAAAALTQATLRLRAAPKFGPDVDRLFFTRQGLEQATRRVVADRRARRLVAAGVRRLADLGCGIGADALACARAGIEVYAVDADPATAAVAAANAAVLDLPVTVQCADATSVDLAGFDAVFCDPARRAATGRVFDPRAYSPPWDFVVGLASRVAVVKLGPGIDHALLPARAEAEWVSVDGEVVEAALWCERLADVPRRASVLRGATVTELTGSGEREAAVGPVRAYVYDPDGAVLRAHLLAELADVLDATIADPTIGYLYADSPTATPFARAYRVDDVLPFSVKRLRATLRERRVGRLTIKKRGSALDPADLRRQLRLSGPAEATVILTRGAGAPTAILCQPVTSAG